MRRLKTGRRPPIYPKTPGHLPCSSLTHPLPLPSRRPSVSFGGFGLRGKVALVTGANHGIGAATATKLAAQGARVFITYYIPDSPYSERELEEARRARVGGDPLMQAMRQQSGEAVVEAIRTEGGIGASLELDLGDPRNIVTLFDQCERTLGPVDILIINHDHDVLETFDPSLVTDQGPQGWVNLTNADSIDTHFAVNARASALMMREYLHRHIRRAASWGRIVSLTTSSAHAWNISYAASKHALVSYSFSAAQEMGKYGITVNVVRPGPTQTGYITPDSERWIVPQTILGRLGEPEDLADVIVFLTSEQGRWVTGQLITVSGGFRFGN